MGKRYRINEIYVSERVETKLIKKDPPVRVREIHQVPHDKDAKMVPNYHKDRGFRLVVYGKTFGDRCLIMWLYPNDIGRGLWNLGTAREAEGHEKKRYFK